MEYAIVFAAGFGFGLVVWVLLDRKPADREEPAARWERNVAQPAVLERYREAAKRAQETKMDREVREAIEYAEKVMKWPTSRS